MAKNRILNSLLKSCFQFKHNIITQAKNEKNMQKNIETIETIFLQDFIQALTENLTTQSLIQFQH